MQLPFLSRRKITAPFSVFFQLRSKVAKLPDLFYAVVTGILFGLVVNAMTMYIQDQIARQQYLEALEHEITINYLLAEGTVHDITELRKNNEQADTFSLKKRYNSTVWDSGNALGYIYSIDPKLQAELSTHYAYIIYPSNRQLETIEEAVNELDFDYTKCTLSKTDCSSELKLLETGSNHYEESELAEAELVFDETNRLMEIFHPAQDRVNNPLLRLFMGSQILPILERPNSASSN